MSPNSREEPRSPSSSPHQSAIPYSGNHNRAMDDLDALKRDRFEMLSAYLDGEVTAAERKQVEHWLATDSETQRLHARLITLQSEFQNLPIPAAERPVEQTVEQVLAQIDRRPRLTLVWSGIGTAVAAIFIGAVTGLVPGNGSLTPQIAQSPSPKMTNSAVQEVGAIPDAVPDSSTLMIALDRPPIDIPRVATDNSN